jgi:hypothetical protein
VAHAEGFGVRHAIPTKYHNPGDLKSARIYRPLPGQKTLGKGGHIVFESDAAGWAALRDYLSKMVDGRSRRFNPDMTLAQVSRVYADNWRPWLKMVTRELNVPANAKLRELLLCVVPEPPQPPQVVAYAEFPPLDSIFPAPPLPPTAVAQEPQPNSSVIEPADAELIASIINADVQNIEPLSSAPAPASTGVAGHVKAHIADAVGSIGKKLCPLCKRAN